MTQPALAERRAWGQPNPARVGWLCAAVVLLTVVGSIGTAPGRALVGVLGLTVFSIVAFTNRRLALSVAVASLILLGFLYNVLHIHANAGDVARGLIPRFDGSDSVLLAVGILAPPSLGQTAPATVKKVALLVGVNSYDKRGFRDLEYAERDIDALAAVLQDAEWEVRLLRGTSTGSQRATLTNIQTAVEATLTGRTKRDLVLVGFAGHGVQAEVDVPGGGRRAESFFCPADAEQGNALALVGHRSVEDALHFTFRLEHPIRRQLERPVAFAIGHQLVAQAHIAEGAAHHHLVIAAPCPK